MAVIYGTQGQDHHEGTNRADTIYGWAPDGDPSTDLHDQLNGLAGADRIYAGAGSDALDGGRDDDVLDGGVGDDSLFGSDGNDELWGRSGHDNLNGGFGNDLLSGGAGDDLLFEFRGRDTLIGGAGDDRFFIYDDPTDRGAKTLDGGAGDDQAFIDHQFATTDLSFVMADEASFTTLEGEGTRVKNIEDLWIICGSGDDTVATLGGNDTLDGRDGNDVLGGRAGDDHLNAGDGRDVLIGGLGDDSLNLFGDAASDGSFGADGAVDTLRFWGNFGHDDVWHFEANGFDRLVFIGFAQDDLVITQGQDEFGEPITILTLDNGTDGGTVTLRQTIGTIDSSDCLFV